MNHIGRTHIATSSTRHLFLQQAIRADLWPEAPRTAFRTLRIGLTQGLRAARSHTITTKTAVRHTEIHLWETALSALDQMLWASAHTILATFTCLQERCLNNRPRWAQHSLHRWVPRPAAQQPDSRWIKRWINKIFDPIKHVFYLVFSRILPQVRQRFCIYHQRVNPGGSFQNSTKLLPISAWKRRISLPFPAAKKLTHHAQ
jgi:hypothetical protein